jgi:hypothetical protein
VTKITGEWNYYHFGYPRDLFIQPWHGPYRKYSERTQFVLLLGANHTEKEVSPILQRVGKCLLSRCLAML